MVLFPVQSCAKLGSVAKLLVTPLSGVFQSRSNSTKLVYGEYGDPAKVVRRVPDPLPETLARNEVLVKILAAPVNPADINTIQGVYPAKPASLPSVPGNECVGEVVRVGESVTGLAVGERVVPFASGLGTWRTHAVYARECLYKVPPQLGLAEAACLTVNPCTAYRMLRDFVSLKPGDTVIQNGANSACGQNVVQICRAWGLKTVNVVRNRPNIDELKSFLESIGAKHVLTEEELRSTDLFKSGVIARPSLALNCVGGQSSLEVLRQLQHGGTMVTYGGMSKQPVTVPTSALIFKDVRVRGFWMTAWTKRFPKSMDRMEMFEELVSMMLNNEMSSPVHEMIPYDNYMDAIGNALSSTGMVGKKYILKF